MEENQVAFDSALENESTKTTLNGNANTNASNDHGWQKVTYPKRQRKNKPSASSDNQVKLPPNGSLAGADNVFRSLEQQSVDRRRRILEAQRMANDAISSGTPARSKDRSDDEGNEDSDDAEAGGENGKHEEGKKVKQKKPKKPKVTVSEAAAKIDRDDLSAFLLDITGSYESQHEIQLMRFADYFGRTFSAVNAAQFPWIKMLRESTVAKMVDIPLSHISEPVYKTSVEWIGKHSIEALASFVLWCLESLVTDFTSQQPSGKGSKKSVQHVSSKSQVAIFVVVAMVLRRRPDVIINIVPTLKENLKYQGQDKLPIIVWMIIQACQGDLAVGLYAWSHNLLPLVSGGKTNNPQTRDLVLQLVERIISMPKARTILVNGAVRKGERLLPPSSFDTLVQVTFPPSSARVKATERFEAIYPTLKEVALAGAPGSKAMKQVSQQILGFAIKSAEKRSPELVNEASGIFIWCLTQNSDCYKQWDKVYDDNLELSVAVLRKLYEQWKDLSVKLSPFDPLRETLKNFRQKNEKALASGTDASKQSLIKDADRYCKLILGRASRGGGCVKSMVFIAVALAVGAAVMSPGMESLDWNKLSLTFSSLQSF